jgi:hypothetical protein
MTGSRFLRNGFHYPSRGGAFMLIVVAQLTHGKIKFFYGSLVLYILVGKVIR